MNNKKLILIFIFILILVSVLLSLNWREDAIIEKITVSGNYTISKEEILTAARLNDSLISNQEINIELIRDRIMKHPEIKKAFVSKELPSELKIEIIEKRPVAILNGENEIKLVDDEPDIFPFKNANKLYDLPVISGVRIVNSHNPKLKYNKDDIRLALFIILNSYKESKLLYNNISEVNLSDTDKIIVYLSEDSSPVYLPRSSRSNISDIKYREKLLNKLTVFDQYIKKSMDIHLKEKINYVDLRFSNQIIVNSIN